MCRFAGGGKAASECELKLDCSFCIPRDAWGGGFPFFLSGGVLFAARALIRICDRIRRQVAKKRRFRDRKRVFDKRGADIPGEKKPEAF